MTTRRIVGFVSLGIFVISLWIFLANTLHYVEKHELGYTFDRFNGEVQIVPHTGWVVRNPFHYSVYTIDLRPYQVSITAATATTGISDRILNAKLVRFNPAGLQTFISWHGCGAGGSVGNLKEILKCYAFDKQNGADCPFVTVVSELSPDQAPIVPQPQENK